MGAVSEYYYKTFYDFVNTAFDYDECAYYRFAEHNDIDPCYQDDMISALWDVVNCTKDESSVDFDSLGKFILDVQATIAEFNSYELEWAKNDFRSGDEIQRAARACCEMFCVYLEQTRGAYYEED